MRYSIPVRKMIRKAITFYEGRSSRKQIHEFIKEKYGDVKKKTIDLQITYCTVNNRARIHGPENYRVGSANDPRYDFLFQIVNKELLLYNPKEHGLWGIRKNENNGYEVYGPEPFSENKQHDAIDSSQSIPKEDFIAVVGMCDFDYTEEILEEIRDGTAREQVLWNHELDEDFRESLIQQIHQRGFARLLMYEKVGSGGLGIRLAAHFYSIEDVDIPDCYNGNSCKTRFHVLGYEQFENPISLNQLDSAIDESLISARSISKTFGYANDSSIEGQKTVKNLILCRIVWNSRNWRYPTGDSDFDKQLEKSFYHTHGFGHEEWLFHKEQALDNFVYSRIQGRPKPKIPGTPMQVLFWSKQDDDKMYLVGRYDEAYYVTSDEMKKIEDGFTRSGILEQRIDDVLIAIKDRSLFGKIKLDDLTQIEIRDIIFQDLGNMAKHKYLKCPADKVVVLNPPVPIEGHLKQELTKRGGHKFDRPFYPNVYYISFNKTIASPARTPDELHETTDHFVTQEELIRRIEEIDNKEPEEPKRKKQRRKTSEKECPPRNQELADSLRMLANDECQICGTSYVSDMGSFCDIHHIKPISEGGGDKSWNIIVVCPNCHRRMHRTYIEVNDLGNSRTIMVSWHDSEIEFWSKKKYSTKNPTLISQEN